MVPGLPLPILLPLNPDAGENQHGAGSHGGRAECCLELLREAGGMPLPVDGMQKYDRRPL